MVHDGAFGAKGGQRHAPANDLAHHRHVRLKARDGFGVNALRATQGDAETGHHLIKHQQGAVLGAQFATTFDKRHTGTHKVHVAADRLHHQAGDVVALGGKSGFELLNVVVFQHHGVLHHLGRDTGTGGVAKGGQAGAGFDQQRVGMAVVAALKFDELAAAGGAACQADGAHGGFSAGAHQAHHVHAGHELQNGLSQLHFALGGGTVREALQHGFLHRFHHGGVTVTQDHGAPRANVVGVFLAIGIPYIGTLGTGDEAWRATNRAKRAHGRIHATGDHFGGAFKQVGIQVGGGGHGQCRKI